jgi:hypothetical protein
MRRTGVHDAARRVHFKPLYRRHEVQQRRIDSDGLGHGTVPDRDPSHACDHLTAVQSAPTPHVCPCLCCHAQHTSCWRAGACQPCRGVALDGARPPARAVSTTAMNTRAQRCEAREMHDHPALHGHHRTHPAHHGHRRTHPAPIMVITEHIPRPTWPSQNTSRAQHGHHIDRDAGWRGGEQAEPSRGARTCSIEEAMYSNK